MPGCHILVCQRVWRQDNTENKACFWSQMASFWIMPTTDSGWSWVESLSPVLHCVLWSWSLGWHFLNLLWSVMQTHLQAPTSSWNTSHILRTDPGAATCSKAHGCCMRAPFVERGRRQDGGCFWPPLSHSGQNLLASFLMSSSVSLSVSLQAIKGCCPLHLDRAPQYTQHPSV